MLRCDSVETHWILSETEHREESRCGTQECVRYEVTKADFQSAAGYHPALQKLECQFQLHLDVARRVRRRQCAECGTGQVDVQAGEIGDVEGVEEIGLVAQPEPFG